MVILATGIGPHITPAHLYHVPLPFWLRLLTHTALPTPPLPPLLSADGLPLSGVDVVLSTTHHTAFSGCSQQHSGHRECCTPPSTHCNCLTAPQEVRLSTHVHTPCTGTRIWYCLSFRAHFALVLVATPAHCVEHKLKRSSLPVVLGHTSPQHTLYHVPLPFWLRLLTYTALPTPPLPPLLPPSFRC